VDTVSNFVVSRCFSSYTIEDEQKPPEPKFLKVTESLCSPLSFKEQLAVGKYVAISYKL